MSKISLTPLVNLENQTTAVNAINANNAIIQTAFDNTLSRDGTNPNTIGANLDLNNFQILNLPFPATADSPARLQDLDNISGGGTILPIPTGGTTGQVLAKTSNADYAVAWTSESTELTAGTNIVLTGSTPTTVSTTVTPVFTSVTVPTIINTGTLTLPTTSDTLVGRNTTDTLVNKTLTAPVISSIVNTGTLTLPTSSDTLVGRATTDTLTNKTLTSPTFTTPVLGTPTSGTLTNCTGLPVSTGISGLGAGVGAFLATPNSANLITAMTDETGSGALVFGTTPTIATPVINGLPTGTGIASIATVSTLASRDSSGNSTFNNVLRSYATTATAAGTTTLTVASTYQQIFTGATTQTVVLPVASTLTLGFSFYIQNNSTGNVTVQSSGANSIVILPGGTSSVFTCILTSGTTAASWTYNATYQAGQIIGSTTNDNANAGNIGEYLVSTIASGSAVSLTTATSTNLTSLSITPGDWDVRLQVAFTGTWTSSTVMRMTLNTTTGTENISAGNFVAIEGGASNGTDSGLFLTKRFSLSATTTIFAVGRGTFIGGTMLFYGELSARRMR